MWRLDRRLLSLSLLLLTAVPLRAGHPDALALAAKVDAALDARQAAAGVRPAPVADDAAFLRRATLELAGRIPSVAEVRAFLNDRSPDKRRLLVDRLLDGPGYVQHFTNVWRAEMLPETDGNFELRFLANTFDAWMRKQLATNAPYDRMARELLEVPVAGNQQFFFDPRLAEQEPKPTAFFVAKEYKPENLAASTARLFLGARLECAQCHDHPFARWKREQFWGYAAFFAGIQRQELGDGAFGPVREIKDRREVVIPNTDRVVQAAFLDGTAPRGRYSAGARQTLAAWVTSPDNPYFARAAVNRYWAYFFGTGLFEPVDDLSDENPPSHPELLDELARQFVAHKYDVKFLIRALTYSRAYQLSSGGPAEDPRLFARAAVKGLTPEQLFDSLAQATGYYQPYNPVNPFIVLDGGNNPREEFRIKFTSQDKRTEAQTSILHALTLMNGKFVGDATSLARSTTLAAVGESPFLDTADRVETLYLATLSRKPRSEELSRFVQYVEQGGPKKDRKTALADVFWALLNSPEFILNH